MWRGRELSRGGFVLGKIGAWRWLGLAAVGALMLTVYWVGLIRPYGLATLGLRPHLDIARLTRGHPGQQLALMFTYVALLGLYYLAWRLCHVPRAAAAGPKPTERRLWVVLVATIAAINLAVLSLYPIGAADVFDYIAQGREISAWHGDPFYIPAAAFKAEPVLSYTAWSSITTLYGPAWQLMGAALTRLAGSSLLINLLAFKTLALLFFAGCLLVVAAILRRAAPERALPAVCLFGLNPLIIYEVAGNGHNDIVMVFWMLLGFYFLCRERHSLAALSLTAGVLTKFVPGFIAPVVLVYSLSRLPAGWPRWRFLLLTGLACAALVAAVAGPFWRGGDMLAAHQRLYMLTTSLPAFVEALLEPYFGPLLSETWVGRVSLILTILAMAVAAWHVWRSSRRPAEHQPAPWLAAARASTMVLLFYLLVACLWFESWYTLWPLSLAVLLPEGPLATAAVLLTGVGIWKPIYFDFFLSRRFVPPRLRRETLLAPAVLGLAWLFAAASVLQAWRRPRPLAVRQGARPAPARGLPSGGSGVYHWSSALSDETRQHEESDG